MTPEQQRIVIAEACGWNRIPAENVGAAARMFYGDIWWRDAENNTIASATQLPDYLNDLNAMHEAEKLLTGLQLEQYAVQLYAILDRLPKVLTCFSQANRDVFMVAHATAAQRAEAFLLTLNL